MAGEIINLADVRMLVVEDNRHYWEELKTSLEEDYGYRAVELAENSRGAAERLDTGYFDVIIADMRLGDDPRGGFSVLNEVKTRNITSIVIILTANESWPDCREAFRAGARDYLSKSMSGDVIEALHRSILEALEYAERYGNRNDELWIEANRETLRRDYPDRYIAVMNNAVIDNDADEESLLARIRERKLPLLVPIVHKITVEDVTKLPIEELIRRGEGQQVEFKRRVSDDEVSGGGKREKKEDPEFKVLKTIAAFLNSEGGVLLIGVADDGAIFGLATDYALLSQRKHWDGFSQRLAGLINSRIGGSVAQYIHMEPCTLEGKEIAVVRVQKSTSPAFVRTKDNNKQFYVRLGNRSDPLDMEQTCRYLADRMKIVMG